MSTQSTVNVTITESALEKVREIMAQQELPEEERNLRIFVDGGGCGGPGFGMAFDRAQQDDVRLERGGMAVVVDPRSLPYVEGATIDYLDEGEVQGFKVSNPNLAAGGCGCSSQEQQSNGCGSGGCGSGSDGGHEHGHSHGGHGGGCC